MKRFFYWLRNVYWFHYKWQTIIGVIVLLFVASFIRDFVTRTEPYINVVIASSEFLDPVVTGIVQNIADETVKELISPDAYAYTAELSSPDNSQYSQGAEIRYALYLQDPDTFLFIVDSERIAYMEENGFFLDIDGQSVFPLADTELLDGYEGVPLYACIRVWASNEVQLEKQQVSVELLKRLIK